MRGSAPVCPRQRATTHDALLPASLAVPRPTTEPSTTPLATPQPSTRHARAPHTPRRRCLLAHSSHHRTRPVAAAQRLRPSRRLRNCARRPRPTLLPRGAQSRNRLLVTSPRPALLARAPCQHFLPALDAPLG